MTFAGNTHTSVVFDDDAASATATTSPAAGVAVAARRPAVVTDRFKQEGGPAYDYLTRRSWGNDTVNGLLAWMSDNQADGARGAQHFLQTQPEIWTQWVAPEVADKVKAAL